MRIERTIVFAISMAIIFLLFLLVGHFPGILKMNWDYMISGDPAWRWVVNILVAVAVAAFIYHLTQRFWPKLLGAISFFLAVILIESFAWHGKEAIEIIKSTDLFVGRKGAIFMAIIALLAFIVNVIIYDSEEAEGG